ncbi:MAG: DUF362 domain-containing protein [Proteobacteria bacterium]|nr:DUF362 domain-containing protein [Pseudomonadota bacterium]
MGIAKKKTRVHMLPWARRRDLAKFLATAGALDCVLAGDRCAVKIHFGEKGNDGYIRPELVKPVIDLIRKKKAAPFLTDTCTIYHGPRNNAIGHLAIAAEHGFTIEALGAPVIIADGMRGTEHCDVEVRGRHFSKVKIGSAIREADSIVVLSHFKGHLLTGFGGAIKNLGMGCGARIGKFEMHSCASPTYVEKLCTACGACEEACAHGAAKVGTKRASINLSLCVGCGECVVACPTGALTITWSEGAREVQERMAEYAVGAADGKRLAFVNFINHVTPNCDCLSKGERSMVPDIGILASADPVAIDQASFDLVLKAAGGDVFEEAHPGIDGTIQLAAAEELGLGRRRYELVQI